MRIYGSTRGGVYGAVYGAPDEPGVCTNPASRIVAVGSFRTPHDAADLLLPQLVGDVRLPQIVGDLRHAHAEASIRLPLLIAGFDQRCL